MAAATGPRKSVSIYDYPEHLNPFRDEDNHNKIRFWTLGKKLNRSNSINFSGIKDLKNSWAFRSFMRKGKTQSPAPTAQHKKSTQDSAEKTSPIVLRRSLLYSSMSTSSPNARTTIGSPERPDRYVYGGSITPLPRSRFQERLRSTSNYDVDSIGGATPRMARSDVTGSRLSVESTNPFDEGPVPPVRAARRKKKKAPLPPGAADVSVNSIEITTERIHEDDPKKHEDLDNVHIPLHVELKIVEDEENMPKTPTVIEKVEELTTEFVTSPEPTKSISETTNVIETGQLEIVEIDDNSEIIKDENSPIIVEAQDDVIDQVKDDRLEIIEVEEDTVKKTDSEDDILNKVSFSKVNIIKYRRNSSVNEDDLRLRKNNVGDHTDSAKRSKSLNNDLNSYYVSYDINLNEDKSDKDTNGNEAPQKVVCKLYDESSRKQSLDNSISSTEKEFIEIDKATRELEREISKLNTALINDGNDEVGTRLSVSEITRKFNNNNVSTPNPIPKPRRSHYGSSSPINSH